MPNCSELFIEAQAPEFVLIIGSSNYGRTIRLSGNIPKFSKLVITIGSQIYRLYNSNGEIIDRGGDFARLYKFLEAQTNHKSEFTWEKEKYAKCQIHLPIRQLK